MVGEANRDAKTIAIPSFGGQTVVWRCGQSGKPLPDSLNTKGGAARQHQQKNSE